MKEAPPFTHTHTHGSNLLIPNSQRKYTMNRLHSFLSGHWTQTFLYWLIMFAGTVSGCVLLLASLWMSINSSVHPFMLLLMSEPMTKWLSYLATTSYIALPEIILASAFVLTIGHYRVWKYTGKGSELAWFILYGIPTLIFLFLSVWTVGSAVTSTAYIMPMPLIVVRAMSGYTFAFVALLHHQLGEKQETDRLIEKDQTIVDLTNAANEKFAKMTKEMNEMRMNLLKEKDDLFNQLTNNYEQTLHQTTGSKKEMERQLQEQNTSLRDLLKAKSDELERVIGQLSDVQSERSDLMKTLKETRQPALEAYGSDVKNWVIGLDKAVTVEEIAAKTGLNTRRIKAAIRSGTLKTTSRNSSLIMPQSLGKWLQNQRIDDADTGFNETELRLVND
jgi:hypothetical protein